MFFVFFINLKTCFPCSLRIKPSTVRAGMWRSIWRILQPNAEDFVNLDSPTCTVCMQAYGDRRWGKMGRPRLGWAESLQVVCTTGSELNLACYRAILILSDLLFGLDPRIAEKLHIDIKSRGEKEHPGGTLVSALIPDSRYWQGSGIKCNIRR